MNKKAAVRLSVCLAGVLAGLILARQGRADGIIDVTSLPGAPYTSIETVFPNWVSVPTSRFGLVECDDTICTGCLGAGLVGVTIFNYGTAGAGDITRMYFTIGCCSQSTTQTLTFAGNWIYGVETFPAWTWSGAWSFGGDPCGSCGGPNNGCLCVATMSVYTDISPCPVDGATIELGPGYNPDYVQGGLTDQCGFMAPWGKVTDGAFKTIRYVIKKADREIAAPGDTVTYSIYYGRPGNLPLTNIIVFDTLPSYTHYVIGGGSAPDPGWDPDPGPPFRLQWTMPGGVTTGGPTGEVIFRATVDWGNGESFEPGSGDIAAPDGVWLSNSAAVAFIGTSCPVTAAASNKAMSVVKRFLYFMTSDNDILYSAFPGQSADDVTYSIFVKNLSFTKTWWDVRIWDTVPAELDPWLAGYGFDDPCIGWTMTPSGCAAASPGYTITGGNTILTWSLDAPPGFTLVVRWKASVRSTTAPGTTAVNTMSLYESGKTGVIDGTGSSVTPNYFTHQAPVVLPTTYISYIGIGAADDAWWECCNTGDMATQSYWLSFFPLNKRTDFNLYQELHNNDAYYLYGGASSSIITNVGGCMTGGADWIAGCKVERAPAFFRPVAYAACPGLADIHHLYKLVSNSPVLWELLTGAAGGNMDTSTYAGTTSLTYSGYISYTYVRVCVYPQTQDGLYIVNTSSLPTTVHVFRWESTSVAWSYLTSKDIDAESMWYYGPPLAGSYMVISSTGRLLIMKGYPGIGVGGAFNDSGSQVPNRENGYLISTTTPASFYAFAGGPANDHVSLLVGNVGGANATYRLYNYATNDPTQPNPSSTHLSSRLVGNSGSWTLMATQNVPAGLAVAGNPYVYGQGYSTLISSTYSMYKVELLSGGPIAVYAGRDVYSPYGCGSVMHSVTPPIGTEYWFHEAHSDEGCGLSEYAIQFLDFYCPRASTVVTAESSTGAKSVYTTTGPDQCVSFKSLTTPTDGNVINWKVTSVGGVIAVAHQIHCQFAEKIYTAPFMSMGVHYTIIAPPVVYAGESFWITVMVVQADNDVETTYCGTSSFTSTDPTANIEGVPMDTYNYTWDSNDAMAPCRLAGCVGTCDNGVAIFVNVKLNRLGMQTIVASDTTDGSITGLGTVMVVGVDVKLTKSPQMAIRASGDTVQFRVCWSNYSTASAMTFVITDAVPMGTKYVPAGGTANLVCGTTAPVPVIDVAYSTSTSTSPPATFSTGNPVSGTRWLRWTVKHVYMKSTGCVCFNVTVD